MKKSLSKKGQKIIFYTLSKQRCVYMLEVVILTFPSFTLTVKQVSVKEKLWYFMKWPRLEGSLAKMLWYVFGRKTSGRCFGDVRFLCSSDFPSTSGGEWFCSIIATGGELVWCVMKCEKVIEQSEIIVAFIIFNNFGFHTLGGNKWWRPKRSQPITNSPNSEQIVKYLQFPYQQSLKLNL